MLKPFLPRFRPDLSARLKDIAEKQVPPKLKPIAGCIRDPFLSPAHLTKPERWSLTEESIYDRVANCAMSSFLTLRDNGKTIFLCYRSILGNIRSHAETSWV